MKRILIALTVSGMTFFGAMQANAITYTFDDKYIGAPPNEDSINGDAYDLKQTVVTVGGSRLTFDIYSLGVGGYFNVGMSFFGIGDLFLDTKGGTGWNYVVDLKDNNSAILYAITQGETENGEYRETKASFTPYSESNSQLGDSWTISSITISNVKYDYLSISIDLSSIWDGTESLGFHWTMTCGNDVVQDVLTPVPEPTTMLLFGTGLVGLAGFVRRRAR